MHFNNIILIGFMGCGKSSIGKRLAARFNYSYLDTDEIIANQVGKSIAAIFASEGEAHFRKLETETLQQLSEEKNIVLSTGGGILLAPENRAMLRSLGTVLWLDAIPDTLFDRATRSHGRPLLNVEHPRHTFNTLLEIRRPLYEETHHFQIDTTDLSYEQTLASIIKILPPPVFPEGTTK